MPVDRQTKEQQFDTFVVGGGIVGLSISWFLARAGIDVLCLDAGTDSGSAANAGSLHGQMQSRMERMFPERIPDYLNCLPIYPRAIDFWGEIAQQLGDEIDYRLTGGLMVAENAGQLAALARKSQQERRCGVATELLNRDEVLKLAPYLSANVQGALFCAKEGKVNPLRATASIGRQAIACGAVIHNDTRVRRLEAGSPGYRAITSRGSYVGQRVVIAAGTASGALAADLGIKFPCAAEALQMCITEPARPLLHHLIQHAERAITLKQLDNGQILIGGGWPAIQTQPGQPPTVIRKSLTGNLHLATQLVPELEKLRIQRAWAGVNTMVDLLSVLGPVDAMPGLHFAVPGDAGFTLGPYCAKLVVDTMLERQPDYPLDAFSPHRFSRTHGGGSR